MTHAPAHIRAAVLRLPFAAPRDLARAHEAAIAKVIHASHGMPAGARRLARPPSRKTVQRFLWALSEMEGEASAMEVGQAMRMSSSNAHLYLSRLRLYGLVTRRKERNKEHLWLISPAGRGWLKSKGVS